MCETLSIFYRIMQWLIFLCTVKMTSPQHLQIKRSELLKQVALNQHTIWSINIISGFVAYTHTGAMCCLSVSLHPLPRSHSLRLSKWRQGPFLLLRYVGQRELKVYQKRLISKVWHKLSAYSDVQQSWSWHGALPLLYKLPAIIE